MWPTSITSYLLAAGLVTLGVVVWQGMRRGSEGMASLRSIGIILFWIGYHLSPLIGYFTGRFWDRFMLVPDEIDAGLLFSLLCMWAYLVGFDLIAQKRRSPARARLRGIQLPRPTMVVLYALTLLTVGGFIVTVGGVDQIWHASYGRGEGQFDIRNAVGRLIQMISVLGSAFAWVTAAAGSLAILNEKSHLRHKIGGWIALAASGLYVCHEFSRGAGMPFVVLGAIALLSRTKHRFRIAFLCLLAAGYLGYVGFLQRGYSNPGLGDFVEAALPSKLLAASSAMETQKAPQFNLLDQMPSWTRVAAIRNTGTGDVLPLALEWLAQFNPIPSEIFAPPTVIDLARIMGTWGHVGVTTPVFAELYYVFGVWGFLLMVPFGSLFAFFDRLPRRMPGIAENACWLLATFGLATGVQLDTRAMTRPLFYALILYTGNRVYESHRRAARTTMSKQCMRQSMRPVWGRAQDPIIVPPGHL